MLLYFKRAVLGMVGALVGFALVILALCFDEIAPGIAKNYGAPVIQRVFQGSCDTPDTHVKHRSAEDAQGPDYLDQLSGLKLGLFLHLIERTSGQAPEGLEQGHTEGTFQEVGVVALKVIVAKGSVWVTHDTARSTSTIDTPFNNVVLENVLVRSVLKMSGITDSPPVVDIMAKKSLADTIDSL